MTPAPRSTKVSSDNRIWQRGWYFEKVAVDPKNPDVVYVPNTGVYKSTDGGKTLGAPIKASPGGDDYHQIWISPDDSNRMIVGGDQGACVASTARRPGARGQPADRADLPRRARFRIPVLG